jgi:hypothetical protein
VLYGGGLFGLVLIGFWLWAIFDVITTDDSLCRNLPKGVWLMLVIFLSSVGALAWLLLGRPENASFRIGDNSPRPAPRRVQGPEDRPGFVSDAERTARYAALDDELDRRIEEKRLREWEEELRRREEDLRGREEP